MKKITDLRSKNLRKDRNSEVVRRMRNGDQLSSFDSMSSWYPPRPIIQKDQTAVRKLYGQSAGSEHKGSELAPHAQDPESHLRPAN